MQLKVCVARCSHGCRRIVDLPRGVKRAIAVYRWCYRAMILGSFCMIGFCMIVRAIALLMMFCVILHHRCRVCWLPCAAPNCLVAFPVLLASSGISHHGQTDQNCPEQGQGNVCREAIWSSLVARTNRAARLRCLQHEHGVTFCAVSCGHRAAIALHGRTWQLCVRDSLE